jgi:uroporphyrinogen-III synthase
MNETKKKILYVITKSNYGGAQRYVYELATGLPKDTFDVVVAFGGNGLLKEKLESAGMRTRTIENFERDIHFFKEFKAYKELKKIIQEEAPDIVHLNSSKAAALGAYAARACGIKKSSSLHMAGPSLKTDHFYGEELFGLFPGSPFVNQTKLF